MTLQMNCKVLDNSEISPQLYMMLLEAPELAAIAQPGQFVHVRVADTSDPLLRRPISLHGIDKQNGTITLLYQVVGRGTQLLAQWEKGREIDVMGPLGKGFILPEEVENITVVGGGIGAAPLFPLLSLLKQSGKKIKVIFGARNKEALIGLDKIREMGLDTYIATDDGSAGHKGFVTDILIQENKHLKPDYIYACGPEPMLAKVVEIALAAGIPGQVSLEERMGCGVGACLACVCKIKVGDGFNYSKVCNEGPVYDLREVLFHG